MTREERAKLNDVLIQLTHDQLRNLTVILYGEDIYTRLKGSSKEGKVASLIIHLESEDDADRFMNLLGERYPDIDLSWYRGSPNGAGKEETPPTEASQGPRSIPREFAERMRQQRPGYDEVSRLTQAYMNVSPEERARMSKRDIIDRFLRPLFRALGWDVWVVTGASGEDARPPDLQLAYRDLRVPVEVREFGGELRGYRQAHVRPWAILTNFETIVIFDLEDYENPSVKLETSPWSYVADGDEKHDLLAAEIFYEKMSGLDGEVLSTGKPQPEEALPVGPGHVSIPPRVVRDAASGRPEDDLLGFEDYAAALYQFIKYRRSEQRLVDRYISPGQSEDAVDEPLTIGIKAGWGMGKTTLMKMIQRRLDESRDGEGKQDFVTVWFDAWQYDQEEALWAALVLTILEQAPKKINVWQHLRLRIGLPFQRFNWGLFLRNLLTSVGYLALVALLVAIAYGIVSPHLDQEAFEQLNLLAEKYQSSWLLIFGELGAIVAAVAFMRVLFGHALTPFARRISDYLEEPEYKERIGFLGQFRQDFERVVKIVTKKGKHQLVVFVDDLDRCSAPKTVEIIEAINILLDAKHCVFVVGMDAAMVACSIEAKYRGLEEHVAEVDMEELPLGRRFLEKIFQITFHIPAAGATTFISFAESTLTGASPAQRTPVPSDEEVSKLVDLIRSQQQRGMSPEQALRAVREGHPELHEEAFTGAEREIVAISFDELDDVRHSVRAAHVYLGANPRKFKRFVNSFRLQSLIASQRGLLADGTIKLALLGSWQMIAIRQPDIVEALAGNQDFIVRLWKTRGLLAELESRRESGQPTQGIEDQLDRLRVDSRIERFIAAADLHDLWNILCHPDKVPADWLPYLLLTRTTADGGRQKNSTSV